MKPCTIKQKTPNPKSEARNKFEILIFEIKNKYFCNLSFGDLDLLRHALVRHAYNTPGCV